VVTPAVLPLVVEDPSEERRRELLSLVEVGLLSFGDGINHSLFPSFLDDKKLSSVLKKMSMTNINAVEEVNIFKNDGTVIHITQPKSNTSYSMLYFPFRILIFVSTLCH
jgi:hypothetical protein